MERQLRVPPSSQRLALAGKVPHGAAVRFMGSVGVVRRHRLEAGLRGLPLLGQLVQTGDRDMRALGAALMAIAMLLAFAPAVPTAAQEEPTGTSYITPFPEGDVYKLQAYGDP